MEQIILIMCRLYLLHSQPYFLCISTLVQTRNGKKECGDQQNREIRSIMELQDTILTHTSQNSCALKAHKKLVWQIFAKRLRPLCNQRLEHYPISASVKFPPLKTQPDYNLGQLKFLLNGCSLGATNNLRIIPKAKETSSSVKNSIYTPPMNHYYQPMCKHVS